MCTVVLVVLMAVLRSKHAGFKFARKSMPKNSGKCNNKNVKLLNSAGHRPRVQLVLHKARIIKENWASTLIQVFYG